MKNRFGNINNELPAAKVERSGFSLKPEYHLFVAVTPATKPVS